ncbi:MAG: substrate-binding domain-containing protein [Bryobacteraceae bacterium]|jgi:ribose transport system substrate-binding protein
MNRNLAILVLAAALLPFAGCSGRHSPSEKFYLVAANTKLQYWQTAALGLSRAAKQLGVQSEMVGPENYDVAAEVQAFRDALATKPSGILVSPADSSLLGPEIDKAIAKGVPVITMDSDAPASKRLSFIGTNNYAAGQIGARVAAKAIGGKGNVVVFTMPGQHNLAERLNGYKDVFAEYPQIHIAQVVDMKGDPSITFDATMQIVQAGKLKPDAWICLEATSCKEVADVLNRNNVKGGTIVAMDTDQDTLDWLRKGAIAATIAQKPFTMALYGLKMLDDLYHYPPATLGRAWAQDTFSPVPVFVDTGTTLIDRGNLDAFVQAQASAKSPQ